MHTGLTGTAETSRLSPRNGLTAYFVLSPVNGLSCHRCRPRTGGADRRQVAAPGPHDFAVRCSVFVCAACTALTQQASIATRTTFRDDRANAPHGGAG